MPESAMPLPLYEMTAEDTALGGVLGISLVDRPAIQVNFVALGQQAKAKPVKLVADKARKMLYGPILIPDQRIYREFEDGPCEVLYRRNVIEEVAHRFMLRGAQRNITHQHERMQEGVVMVESWIKEGPSDKSVQLGFNAPDGTWFGGAKVLDDAYWQNEVMTGKVMGFSLEGFFQGSPAKRGLQPAVQKLQQSMFTLLNLVKGRKAVPTKPLRKLAQAGAGMPAVAPDGSEIVLIELDGTFMMMPLAGGEITPAADGVYQTGDGEVTIAAGKIAEVSEQVEQTGVVELSLATGHKFSLPENFESQDVFDAAGNKLGSLQFQSAPELVETNPAESNTPVVSPTEVTALKAQLKAMQAELQAVKQAQTRAGLKPVNTGNAAAPQAMGATFNRKTTTQTKGLTVFQQRAAARKGAQK